MYLGEQIAHGHSALGVRVADSDPDPAPGGDDFVSHVAVFTHAVAHQAQLCSHLYTFRRQNAQRLTEISIFSLFFYQEENINLHESCDGSSTAFVPGHTGHHSSGLDVGATSVVSHTLADQAERFVDGALSLVGQVNHSPLVALNY